MHRSADLAGGGEHPVEGDTVMDVLVALERTCPHDLGVGPRRAAARSGGTSTCIVNGELAREDTAVGDGDRIDVLPGDLGRLEMTEVLVGTKKGLFVLEGDAGARRSRSQRARSPGSRSSTRCAIRARAATSRR